VENTDPFSKPALHGSVNTFVTDVHLQQNNVINYRHSQSVTSADTKHKTKRMLEEKKIKTCLVNGLQKVVQNLPDGIQLIEMIRSIEFRNEIYLSAAHAGLITT
jgi:hypothetical protein